MGKHKKKSKKHSSSSSEEVEWVEKYKSSASDEEKKDVNSKRTEMPGSSTRDDWMSLPTSFESISNIDKRQNREVMKRKEQEDNKYNPRTCSRELNPYWRDGGDGLPKFKKPSSDDEETTYLHRSYKRSSTSNWKKKPRENIELPEKIVSNNTNVKESNNSEELLSDKELNILAAKLVKAEIMGNTKLINELKEKLENARESRDNDSKSNATQGVEDVVLTETDSLGRSRPVKSQSNFDDNKKKKKQKIDTHKDGERIRYFADDDKYSLKQMFENEKFQSVEDQNIEFARMAGKVRKNDDLDDVFSDKIRRKESDAKIDARNKSKAINEHQKVTQSLDNCRRCIQSDVMLKHLMVSMGETVYLSLPAHEPLTEGHCLIVPIRHVSCATQLDENEWSELMDFRRALTKMFASKNEDVIYFETSVSFHRYPHMSIECVPLPKEEGDLAPIYFKKAIDESEIEWTQNKKLISMKGKDVRRAVPKGLSYFCVSFGMDEGYAHVIEDEKLFPNNFAQEIIGGMLDLHHSKWRKPKLQSFDEQSGRVLKFSQDWSVFDCTNK